MSDDKPPEPTRPAVPVTRRQLLRLTGAGVGALAAGGFSATAAAEAHECANGPFEATYEPGTVNVGQIRADQARGQGPPSLGAGSPTSDRGNAGEELPPKKNAQETNDANDANAGTLTVHTEYDGVDSLETRGGVPSDSQVAVGNGKLLHVLNRDIAIYNKDAGNREQHFRLERLWEPVIPEPEGGFAFGIPFVFDPRARYDRNHDRFIIAATQFQEGIDSEGNAITLDDLEEAVQSEEAAYDPESVSRPPKGWFVVAVSATSNPNGKWYVYRVPPEDASGINNEGLVDYPTLGHDKDAVYLTQNFFGAGFDITLVTLDKSDLYAGKPVTAHHFDGMFNSNAEGLTFTVQPAQQPFSGGSDGTFYLVNSDFPFPDPTPETLTLWELSDPTDDPTLECYTLDVNPYSTPLPARQPESDSLIDTLGTRVMNADYADGSLWTAHSTLIQGDGGRPVAAIRWYEIDVSSRSVAQSGTFGTSERSTFMPTIRTNGDAMLLSHNVSGPETYVRMDVAGRTSDHTQSELEDSVVVEEGKSKYDALPEPDDPDELPVERWGDYNGISIDPQSGRFWAVSQYSPDIDIPVEEPGRDPYATRIAEVSFESGPGNSGGGNGGGNGGNGGGNGGGPP